MKRLILTSMLIAAVTVIRAQGIEIAVFAEPQAAWLSSDDSKVVNNGPIINLNSGIEVDLFFMPNYAFTVGLNMNNLGSKLMYSPPPDSIPFIQNKETNDLLYIQSDHEVKHKLQYLGIPVGLKLKTEELGFMTIYFHGGFSPLINLKSTTSSVYQDLQNEDIRPEINLFSFNYFVEMGIEYRLAGNTAIIAGLKYSAGFNDVTKNDVANVNLHSAGLHLGLMF